MHNLIDVMRSNLHTNSRRLKQTKMSMTSTDAKQIHLHVPKDYEVDPFLLNANPHEVALILDLASKLPRVVQGEQSEMQARLVAARDDSTRDAIRKVLEEATARANESIQHRMTQLTVQLESSELQRKQMEQNLKEITEKFSNLEKNHIIELTDTKYAMNIQHSKELTAAEKQLDSFKIEYENMKEHIDSCVQKARLETESNLNKTIQELQTLNCSLEADKSQMKEKIQTLEQPMAKGNIGEYNVTETLTGVGFHVEDTSSGERKNAGYLDLLVTLDKSATDSMRIAVEVKNKSTTKKASAEKVNRKQKDIDDDIKTFQTRVRDGIRNNLFDAAVFVSLRASTKMGAPVVLQMFDDITNRPLAPVSYIGPEKSKYAPPLAQEQLETHMYMMFCLLEKTHAIRADLCNGLKDEELSQFQTLFEQLGAHFNQTFVDLRKNEQLISEMTKNLNIMRCRAIQMCRSVVGINSQIPWLQRKGVEPEWMSVYETAKEKSLTMSESQAWNSLSRSKATIESTIGMDAMRMAIRSENKQPQVDSPDEEPEPKKPKA